MIDKKDCGSPRCEQGNPQPVANFHRNKQNKSGYHSYCKACRLRETEERREHKRRYDAARYPVIREGRLAYQREYYLSHTEKIKRRVVAWTRANRERRNSWMRGYRVSPYWRAKGRIYSAQRRARLRQRPVETFAFREILLRDRGCCRICGWPVSTKHAWPHPLSASLDHVVPISRGGAHLRSNVQLAHLRCNLRKAAKVDVAHFHKLVFSSGS